GARPPGSRSPIQTRKRWSSVRAERRGRPSRGRPRRPLPAPRAIFGTLGRRAYTTSPLHLVMLTREGLRSPERNLLRSGRRVARSFQLSAVRLRVSVWNLLDDRLARQEKSAYSPGLKTSPTKAVSPRH